MRSTPPEILEHIAGFCAQDKHTLCQLSLVSTSCLALARRQLFAEITLKPPSPTIFQFPFERLFIDSPCSGFLALINDAERRGSQLGTVAPFVRHLRLHEGSGMSSWLVTDPSLPPLLQALPNLLSFRLSRVGVTPISWIGIPFACRNAIGKFVLSQSTLIEVTLSGLAFQSLQQLNTLLASCRALRTLEVDHVGVQEGELEAETGASVEKVALDTLTLGPFTSILFMRSLLQPSCPMRLDVVRKLGLSMSDNFSELTRILDASISLETLELVVTNRLDVQKYWALPPSEQLDLSKLPSLCHLRITFDTLQGVDELLQWLAAVLRTGIDRHSPTGPNMMKNMSFVFTLFVTGLRVDHLTDATVFSRWRTVDNILCGDGQTQTHAYSNLKRVNLGFILKKHINLPFAPRFLNELVLDSPGLREGGLLSVNAIDACGWNP